MAHICDIITCPVCNGTLVREGGSLVCTGGAKRHTYDVSKEGYVNLLPPGKEKNAHTGDDAAMVRARVQFLATDAYAPLSDEIARLIAQYTSAPSPIVIDSGCGEGYHTCRYTKDLAEHFPSVLCAAFDASKHATAAGAKLARRLSLAAKGGVGTAPESEACVSFMTGNIFRLPVKAECADAVVSMFAPIAWEENLRMLKHGGILVVAASGKDHLDEMRSVIYDEVIKKSPDVVAGEGFEHVCRTNISYPLSLGSSEEIMNLFGMTPFCYKTPKEAVERLRALTSLDVTVNTDFFVFRKI